MGNIANHLAWKEEGKHGLAWYVYTDAHALFRPKSFEITLPFTYGSEGCHHICI